MKTKFFATAILTITVLFTLTACGNAQNNASSNSPDLTTEQSEKQSSTEYQSENNNSANGQTSNTLGSSEKAESSIDQAGKQNTADKPTAGSTSAQGEAWKIDFEKDLFKNYQVKPDHYEDLGNGIYQVYVVLNGKVVPFVTVDSATGDYHG